MREWVMAAALLLGACAAPAGPAVSASLTAADASTTLLVGERLTMETRHPPTPEGSDPLVVLTLRHEDGRTLTFNSANHAPHHVMAQRPGGALAQIMGLFGEEAPSLYSATERDGAPFLCGPEGPVALGLYETAAGQIQIVGLRQEIRFETRPDGTEEALPYSPDQVCARLRFQRG
ncbi:MAG: hypothetical protein JNK94_04750 [Hyphomonadaceae bacterium]|nr:hypothetical protein [Hyphomonadaceae bacterium]